MKPLITDHAVDRYRERVRDCGDQIQTRYEMLSCLKAAKQKHLRKAERKKKRTVIVPTGCCLFVFGDGGRVVTVLQRPSQHR